MDFSHGVGGLAPFCCALRPANTEGRMPALLTARELRERRANLFQQADQILTRAREEKRDLTSEEQQEFDRLHAEIDRLGEEARRIERHEAIQRELEESRGVVAGRQDRRGGGEER